MYIYFLILLREINVRTQSSQLSVVIWSETVGDAAGTETKVIKASQIEGHDNLYDLFCVTMHVLSNYSSH